MSPAATGKAKLRRSLAGVIRRQGMIGPMPARATMAIASGSTNGRNAAWPTLISLPVSAWEMSGKNVTQKMTSASATSNMFWATNTASRLNTESIVASERKLSRRHSTRPIEASTITETIATNAMSSVGSGTKAWIEDRIPERTRKSPTIAITPASSTSETFHVFSRPRFSWIMIEWMYAVATSHGMSAAFSTGSQPQKPPHPSSV